MDSLKKRLLPASSSSFHYFERKVYELFDKNFRIANNLNDKIDNLEIEIESLHTKIAILEKQLSIYSETLYKNDNDKDSFSTRVRLFKNLPEATGALRQCQRATSKLMSILDEILRKNNLEYWFGYGSLLGAYTRNSPIPWDDDVDICMTRDSLNTLLGVLESNKEYHVTIVYDWYVKCIQYRFCSRNISLPTFIDIGVWDYATKRTDKNEERLRELRTSFMNELTDDLLPYWKEQKLLLDARSGYNTTTLQLIDPDSQDKKKAARETRIIKRILDNYIDKATSEGIFCSRDTAAAYAYSIDNLYMPGRRMIYEKEMISPICRCDYDGFKISIPKKPVDFLNTCYSAWPFIPSDASLINSSHIDSSLLKKDNTKKALDDFLK